MNVPTISMNPAEAAEKLEAYRESLHKRADEQYEAISQGYEALADEKKLVDVSEALVEGGLDYDQYPRLAICRADRREVAFRAETTGWGEHREVVGLVFDARAGRFPVEKTNLHLRFPIQGTRMAEQVEHRQAFATVPPIPAQVRNSMTGQDRDHFILWEVDEWRRQRNTAQPPRDPWLLSHLGGHLYVVEDGWDLTDLERAVIAGDLGN